MSRFFLRHGTERLQVELNHAGNHIVFMEDGKKKTAEVLVADPPHYVIRLDTGKIINCIITGDKGHLTIGWQQHHYSVEYKSDLGNASIDDDVYSSDHADLSAPMPGQIVAIHKSMGDAVLKGDPLIIIEAMKMQNALTAPMSGIIHAIHVSAGAKVESGQLLISICKDV